MPNSVMGRESLFGSDDSIRTSVDSASHYLSVDVDHEFKLRIFNPESWMGDMMTVQERRQKFFSTMGFVEFISPQSEEPSGDFLSTNFEMKRPTAESSAAMDSFSASNDGGLENYSRDLDNGEGIILHEHSDNCFPALLNELDSENLLAYQEFDKLLGLPCSVHEVIDREASPSDGKPCEGFAVRRRAGSWWSRIFKKTRIVGMCKHYVSVKIFQPSRTTRPKVLRHRKRCRELTGLFIEQEIGAHDGSIRVIKFSPSGWYLASGGEDCIVRIWQIKEAETSCKCAAERGFAINFGEARCSSLIGTQGSNCAAIVFPKKAFKILEKPIHEFNGHASEILDLSWSSSDLLLSSSTDKTVRLWKVGCDGCLHVFLHNDYVTCIQFNPADEKYFISGSIDGKVRIWGISENHVVDWVDIRDIVTAVCYRPDGKGFVVGSINGICRFYDHLAGNSTHLYMQFSIEGKQKSYGKRVIGLQFSPDDKQRILVTSADSRVRIFDGFNVVDKFRGLRKTRRHMSASFTSNGRHIVSVGDDSNVYIWNNDFPRKQPAGRPRSIRSFEAFFSERASIAVPWPNMFHQLASPRTNINLHLLPPIKNLRPSTWFSNSECIFPGFWLLADGISRVGPAEKLPLSGELLPQLDNDQICYYKREMMSLPAMWNMGIVTASSDGFIRSFHNYGLPLWS